MLVKRQRDSNPTKRGKKSLPHLRQTGLNQLDNRSLLIDKEDIVLQLNICLNVHLIYNYQYSISINSVNCQSTKS